MKQILRFSTDIRLRAKKDLHPLFYFILAKNMHFYEMFFFDSF